MLIKRHHVPIKSFRFDDFDLRFKEIFQIKIIRELKDPEDEVAIKRYDHSKRRFNQFLYKFFYI